jgi:hypothetical protein
VITGFCFSAASSADQQAAETFFAVRAYPNPRLSSVGSAARGPYVTDKGFEGENHRRWLDWYGAQLICPPKRNAHQVWPKRLRRWAAGIRQIVETVYDKLFNTFGLWRERPHELQGFCGLAWRRELLCTISASGSTSNSGAPCYPSPTCWGGDLKTHTKRLSESTHRGDVSSKR